MTSAFASRIRSGYAWIVFAVILLGLLPVAFFAAKIAQARGKSRNGLRRLVGRWLSVYAFHSPLYHFHIQGREHLPLEGAYVLVANHESGLDVLCLFLLGSPARFLSADWVTRIPAVGPLFHWCEYIAMDPASRESRARAMAEVARSLASGTPVAIFPEGRIPDPSEGLAEFRPGAFRAALEAGVPIVPVVLSGTGRAWAPRTVTVEGRHTIHIRVLPAIHATPGSQAPAQLAAFVRAEMERAVATLR
jgi:1-acyl-sn-glycerol-3-phosphate acyltransferase